MKGVLDNKSDKNVMKIGKLTQDGYGNYGNILQNYALQEFLLGYADIVDSVWHTPSELLSEYWQWGLKGEIKYLINYKDFRNKVKSGYMAWEYVRNARFYDFSQAYIHNVNPSGSLNNISDKYDYFVVGSDQVWKPTSKRLDIGFLKFAPKEKRISYAASMGVEIIPDAQKNYFRESFNDMYAISVREDSAAKIIEELTGRKSTVVMDPCFSLNAEKWREISRIPYWIPENKYMFLYFLGPMPKNIQYIAQKYQLEIVNVFSKSNFYYSTMSPQEWIALIDNAELIYTDSFHCSVFSMIFHKPYVVCDRIGDVRTQQMRTRLITLLEHFKQQDRFVCDNSNYEINDPFTIDYSQYDSVLEQEWSIANDFLKSVLK